MGLKDRVLELIGARTPVVHDPAADEGRAPVPGELQPEIPDYPTEDSATLRNRVRDSRPGPREGDTGPKQG
jgi:hypothetical protein